MIQCITMLPQTTMLGQPLYIHVAKQKNIAQLREMIELSFLFSTKVHAWLTYQCFNGNKYLTTQYPNIKTRWKARFNVL